MKTNHSIKWIHIGLVCLALALVVILMTIPLLAKAISQLEGNPIKPEQLDIRPIPVPVPPPPMVSNGPIATATPAPVVAGVAAMPKAIPVPISPPVVITRTESLPAQSPSSESSILLSLPMIRLQTVLILMTFTSLFLLMWLHQAANIHPLGKRNHDELSINSCR